MPKQVSIEQEGVITEALSNGVFRVELDNGHRVIAHIAGKMRQFNIRLIPGDDVVIEMSPYDLTKGRITYRGTAKQRLQRKESKSSVRGGDKGKKGRNNTGKKGTTGKGKKKKG